MQKNEEYLSLEAYRFGLESFKLFPSFLILLI
ncbi:hypothetical protein CLV98_101595 [Dyadobacter jejuensis]|uniref:Uncharacterized protein n=1 Tax=Dyadobacter jejuensis TaxID=1082580 RepID=A0A316ASI9_9BACT|nr:hypothetical protein CLV98_101595 [Dyadobacter jejuensis]